MIESMGSVSRREFLRGSTACAAHAFLMAAPFPTYAQALWSTRALGQTVSQEPFGRLEEVGPGLFALISTPLTGDYTTVCNGGIIAGRSGVLVVEAFQTPEGAAWMAGQARILTGRWPTHVLITHYHGDHTGGLDGYFPPAAGEGGTRPAPEVLATPVTRDLRTGRLPDDAPEALRRRWADVILVSPEESSTLDLGGRVVELTPRRGHTPSDCTVEVPDQEMVWCGDLVWNGMFPNYMDAIPSRLSGAVRSLQAGQSFLYIPGHGPLADQGDLVRYVQVIDGIEETARRARREGWTAQEAAERHQIPGTLGEWTLFNPSYFQRAVEAWMMEWEGTRSPPEP
jgi:glyoxylase-like metal-dependent hydrolase (beta-lactamase superfamily II)